MLFKTETTERRRNCGPVSAQFIRKNRHERLGRIVSYQIEAHSVSHPTGTRIACLPFVQFGDNSYTNPPTAGAMDLARGLALKARSYQR
jgi:hypothetical protein